MTSFFSVEYNISYVYHALYAYFDRDNVALPGLAEYFDHQSAEEREHAEKLMEYQNKRGGRVKLMSITSPRSEFYHKEKVSESVRDGYHMSELIRETHCTQWSFRCLWRN